MNRLDKTIRALERRRLEGSGMTPDEIDFFLSMRPPRFGEHMPAHRMQQDESLAPWQIDDPITAGNTTTGGGILFFTQNQFCTLRSKLSSTEVRTMPDPNKAYIMQGYSLFQKTTSNLTILFNTPIWLGATVTQPALTQLGQLVTFTTVDHTIWIQSVPCNKVSFVGTQNTITNKTGFRWMLLQSDGPALT